MVPHFFNEEPYLEQGMKNNLEVKNLSVSFLIRKNWVQAIDDVSFSLYQGEILGIVGESGCGKSVTSMSILHLLPETTSRIDHGSALFQGQDLCTLNNKAMSKIRGKKIAMIFQDSMTSLNPVVSVGKQLVEAVMLHNSGIDKQKASELSINILGKVGIPSPSKRFKEYPHQLSGGMRQRVMIAMSLIQNPDILIADEPTTSLDVTIQAQILELLRNLGKERDVSVMLITHDMGVVAEMADRVLVMYAGNVMEVADVKSIFKNPLHPYTQGLLASIPRPDVDVKSLFTIEGNVPTLTNMPKGCRFCSRCKKATKRCEEQKPPLFTFQGHQVRCWLYENSKEDN